MKLKTIIELRVQWVEDPICNNLNRRHKPLSYIICKHDSGLCWSTLYWYDLTMAWFTNLLIVRRSANRVSDAETWREGLPKDPHRFNPRWTVCRTFKFCRLAQPVRTQSMDRDVLPTIKIVNSQLKDPKLTEDARQRLLLRHGHNTIYKGNGENTSEQHEKTSFL